MLAIEGFYSLVNNACIKVTARRAIAEEQGIEVGCFRELCEAVAKLAYRNPRLDLAFRGQDLDYMTRSTKSYPARSSIFPSIYRYPAGEKKLSTTNKDNRFAALDNLVATLINNYPQFDNISRLKKYHEVQWAILQHYGVCDTPLIDVTDSLHIAATFALRHAKDEGFLYVFGLPRLHNSISYHVDENMVVVKLASACPPHALRAHFQQAYFVGSFPYDQERKSEKNLAQRMIAKFRLKKANFWKHGFRLIEDEVLYPDNDEMCNHLHTCGFATKEL